MKTARTSRTAQRARDLFLEELARRGIVTDACQVAGIGRRTVYEWRDADPEFAQQWEDALERAIQVAEREAWRRGVEGVDEPVFGRIGKDQDGEVGTIRKYSDTMLTLVLKANKPEKYREKVDHEHRGSVNVEFVNNWREAND